MTELTSRPVSRRGVIAGMAGLAGAVGSGVGLADVAGAATNGGSAVDGVGGLSLSLQPAAAATPVVPGVSYLQMTAPFFSALGAAISWLSGTFPTGGAATMRHPIDLPIGSALVQFEVYGRITGAGPLTFTIRSWDFSAIVNDPPLSTLASTSVAETQTGTIAGSPLVRADRNYMIEVSGADSTHQILGARVGYLPPTAGFVAVNPQVRKLDTRSGAKKTKGSITTIDLGPDVPVGAAGALVSLTATETVGALGFYTAFPGSVAVAPNTSNLNWYADGQVVANTAIVGLGGGTTIKLLVDGAPGAATHVLVDLLGYFA